MCKTEENIASLFSLTCKVQSCACNIMTMCIKQKLSSISYIQCILYVLDEAYNYAYTAMYMYNYIVGCTESIALKGY